MHTTETDIHPADIEGSPFDRDDWPETGPEPQARPHHVSEPTALADIAKAPEISGLLFMRGLEEFTGTPHPYDGKCKVCGNPLDQLWRQIDARLAPGWFPVTCCESCYAEAKEDPEAKRRNREIWERICPTEFRTEWDNAKGSATLFKRIIEWGAQWNVREGKAPKRGLVIHGDTGSAKTRACWHLYRRLLEEGVGTLFIEAIDLLDSMPQEAFHVPVLIIDDLGNDAPDFRKEQRLLKLLRARANWHRHVVVTTQYVGAALVSRFKQEATGAAVVRRLRDPFCDSVQARHADQGTVTTGADGRKEVRI
ncbi:DNA replication protein [Opitutaceae bacterium TAV1]|nr:DNA replication protein [Opitutaceae bacterium TAV1]